MPSKAASSEKSPDDKHAKKAPRIAIEIHDLPMTTYLARGRQVSSPWTQVVRLGGFCGLLLCVGVTAFSLIHFSSQRPETEPKTQRNRSTSVLPSVPREIGTVKPLVDFGDLLQPAVVEIETRAVGGSVGSGSGFVIDDRGLLATSFHVLSEASQASAKFANGEVHEIAGYVAIDQERDVAIVKLMTAPLKLEVLPLSEERKPPSLSSVVAMGYPHGAQFSAVTGRINRVVSTSELPGHSRAFLRKFITGEVDHEWIQHSASIATGHSGGPLVNEEGEVIGVNTWVDRESRFGYALHVRYLRKMKSSVGQELTQLQEFSEPSPQLTEILRRLEPQEIERTFQAAENLDWQPVSSSDYEKLQQCAWVVAVARLPGSLVGPGGLGLDELEHVKKSADQFISKLRYRSGNWSEEMHAINHFAGGALSKPMRGLVVFAHLKRIVEGETGGRDALFQMPERKAYVLVPLEGSLFDAPPNTLCLILGVNHTDRMVRLDDAALERRRVSVVASGAILEIEK